MKVTVFSILSIFMLLQGCGAENNKSNSKEITVKKSDIFTQKINISGMTCVGCEVTLEKALFNLDGVVEVKASHADNSAVIQYDKTKTDTKKITQAIKEAGYISK